MQNLIHKVATYQGAGNPYLQGYDVLVVAVVKRPGGDPDAGTVCHAKEAHADAGGLNPEHDIIEVVAWLGEPYNRWGFVPSDVCLAELVGLREAQ